MSGGVGPLSAWSGRGGRKNRPDDDGFGCLFLLVVGVLLLSAGVGLVWKHAPVLVWIVGGVVVLLLIAFGALLLLGTVMDRSARRSQRGRVSSESGVADPNAEPEADVPVAISYGYKAKPAFAKAWPEVATRLEHDEVVRAVFRVNGIRPAVDLVIITDQRLLAFSVTPGPAKVNVALDAIDGFRLSRATDSILLKLPGRASANIGYLRSKRDLALFQELVSLRGPTR